MTYLGLLILIKPVHVDTMIRTACMIQTRFKLHKSFLPLLAMQFTMNKVLKKATWFLAAHRVNICSGINPDDQVQKETDQVYRSLIRTTPYVDM